MDWRTPYRWAGIMAGSKPTPRSRTSTRTPAPALTTLTSARSTPAWRATLRTASATAPAMAAPTGAGT